MKQHLERKAASILLNAPHWLTSLLLRPPKDGARELDPRLHLLLETAKCSGNKRFCDFDVEGARKHYRALVESGELPEEAVAHEFDIVLAGSPARVLHPDDGRRALPFLLYLHGGGFTIGGIETHLHVGRRLARAAGAVVILLDYPLAPEAPFPAAVETCTAAVSEVRKRATELTLDPTRGAVGGDSAGGNLAAVVSPNAGLQAQLLYYPATDAGASSGSRLSAAKGFGLETADVDWFTSHYAPNVDLRDPRLSPRWAENLASSPRTRLVLAGFDPLRDEGRRFGSVLRDAGVTVDMVERSAWIHGFVHMGKLPGVPESLQADGQCLGTWLRN